MTPIRLCAGLAALITALVLQGAIVGPVSAPLPMSLPLVLVASVALVAGPGTGLVIGFGGGLVADLAGNGPIGLLALIWMLAGLSAGWLGGHFDAGPGRRPRRAHQVGVVTLVTGVAGVLATIGAAAIGRTLGDPGLLRAVSLSGPALLGQAVLALGVLPAVAAVLRTPALRRPPTVRAGAH